MEISVQAIGSLIENIHAITTGETPARLDTIPEDAPDTNDATVIGNPSIDSSFNSSSFDEQGGTETAANTLQNNLQDTDTVVLPVNVPQDTDQQIDPQDGDQQNQDVDQQNNPQDSDQQNDPQDIDQQNDPQDVDQQNDQQDTESIHADDSRSINVLQVNSTATALQDNTNIQGKHPQQHPPEPPPRPFASHTLNVNDEAESSASDQEDTMDNLDVEVDGDDYVVEVYL